MKKFSMSITFLTMVLPVFFVSCEKDVFEHCPEPDDTNGKPPAEKQLLVVLNNQYMPAVKVDSAIAIWDVNGTSKTVKLQVKGDQLSSSLTNFQQSGSGTLTIQIFTQIQIDGKPLQWEKSLPYTLDRNTDKTLDGPQNIKDPLWNPRAIFRYDNAMGSSFSCLVALRPEDAYFELKGVAPVYSKRVEIIRSFYLKESNTLVASRGWVCSSGCLDSKGNLVNREHFRNLVEQMNGRQWDQYRITAYFYLNSNVPSIYEFNLSQDVL